MLAGWLFADLLLMLFLVSFASSPEAKPAPSASASASPSPTTTPANAQSLISKDFCEFLLDVNTAAMATGDAAEGKRLIARLNSALTGQYPAEIIDDRVNDHASRASCLRELALDPRAGVIISYGSSPDVSTGYVVGQHAAEAITHLSDRFRGASSLWGWTAQYGSDKLELIVFFAS